MNDYFNKCHPLVSFSYFLGVIGFGMFLNHPVYMGIGLSAAVIYSIYLNGKRAIKFNVIYMLPMLIVVACINPLFNHEGATILFYLRSGNPFTLESVIYGIVSGVMLITVVIWFSCYNAIMTSDKIMYLFGRMMPSLSLIFAMALRLVPLFRNRVNHIMQGQKALGRDVAEGTLSERFKKASGVLSILVGWSLENAVESADSMKARGYGLKGRTAFSNFIFTKTDGVLLAIIWGSIIAIMVGLWKDVIYVQYFPMIKYSEGSLMAAIGYIIYGLLCYLPLGMNIMEAIKWKYFISKI